MQHVWPLTTSQQRVYKNSLLPVVLLNVSHTVRLDTKLYNDGFSECILINFDAQYIFRNCTISVYVTLNQAVFVLREERALHVAFSSSPWVTTKVSVGSTTAGSRSTHSSRETQSRGNNSSRAHPVALLVKCICCDKSQIRSLQTPYNWQTLWYFLRSPQRCLCRKRYTCKLHCLDGSRYPAPQNCSP